MISMQLAADESMESGGPRLIEIEGQPAPASPTNLEQSGLSEEEVCGLLLKCAYLHAHFSTLSIAEELCLPRSLVEPCLQRLKKDNLLEILGQDGPLSYRWTITDRGRERAARLLEICGYIGPAPVPLQIYNQMIEWQCDHLPRTTLADLEAITRRMVLPQESLQVAGLAAMSHRSLLLYGPPGNGKTTMAHLLHESLRGWIWLPYAIAVANTVISVYDPQLHEREDPALPESMRHDVDNRWVRVRRPLVIAAGELQLDNLDLSYSTSRGYYEAPVQMKSNGGIFLLDDLGYQRVNPFQLLNRWVFPLERQTDFLTLHTGQKLRVPFRSFLIISTNLDPHTVMEPAILRRIGYRLHLDNPTPSAYGKILHRCAAEAGAPLPHGVLEQLLHRHRQENRPLRGCEPRDLLERARDICRFRGQPLQLDAEIFDLAWVGYFGEAYADEEVSPESA